MTEIPPGSRNGCARAEGTLTAPWSTGQHGDSRTTTCRHQRAEGTHQHHQTCSPAEEVDTSGHSAKDCQDTGRTQPVLTRAGTARSAQGTRNKHNHVLKRVVGARMHSDGHHKGCRAHGRPLQALRCLTKPEIKGEETDKEVCGADGVEDGRERSRPGVDSHRPLNGTHANTHARTHARTHACTYARTRARARTHARTHTCAHACTQARTRARARARMHATTHARTYAPNQ